MSEHRTLRHVIVGVGAGVLGMHRPALDLETTEIVGVYDLNQSRAQEIAAQMGVPAYADLQTLLAETNPDIAVVIAPHPFHAPLTIACLEAGCHVLVEKPIAVQASEADAMVEAAARTNRLLAVNFQQRLRPEIMAARGLVQSGALGRIQHVDLKVTWTRTAIYYRLSDWRGTWKGEGGALLMNQAPHELDLICHLFGLPARVFAWTRTVLHQIEAEDTVQAMLEWGSGTLGAVHISTAEASQPQRIEVIGTRGRLDIMPGALKFHRFNPDLDEVVATDPSGFGAPAMIEQPVELPESEGTHRAVYQNLHHAILHGTPLVVEGASAGLGLELANAMIYSSYTNQPVEFPLDRQKYADLLAALREGTR